MIHFLLSLITQSVPVSVNDLAPHLRFSDGWYRHLVPENLAIREQRRFLLPFSKKGREKQDYGLKFIDNILNRQLHAKEFLCK